MAHKQNGLVRVGEVIADMGGPAPAIPAASPQARQSRRRPVEAPTLKRIDYFRYRHVSS